MFNNITFSELIELLNLLVVPLFVWVWKTDRKTLVLENEINFLKMSHHNMSKQFEIVLEKLDEIKDEIHNSFVSQKSCEFRHR